MPTRATRTAAVRPCTTPECQRMKALFAEWHDRALHWRTRRSLDAHLAACPPCAAFFRSMEKTILVVRTWPGVEVPAPVRGHLRELLQARHERRRPRRCACRGKSS